MGTETLILKYLYQTANRQKRPLPVIDKHLHALRANEQGPAPVSVGAPSRDLGILLLRMQQILRLSPKQPKLVTIEQSGHASFIEGWKSFITELLNFIK